MKSSPGVIVRSTRWDNPAHTPSGMPMSRLTSTAASVSASVSMASCHRPCSPMNSSPKTVRSATLTLPKAQERKPATATTPSQPSTGAGLPRAGWLIRPWMSSDQGVDRQPDRVEEVEEERAGVAVGVDRLVEAVQPGVQRRELGRGQRQRVDAVQRDPQHDPGDQHAGDATARADAPLPDPGLRQRGHQASVRARDDPEDLLVADDADHLARSRRPAPASPRRAPPASPPGRSRPGPSRGRPSGRRGAPAA